MHEQPASTDSTHAGVPQQASELPQKLELATVALNGEFHRCHQFQCKKSERVSRFLHSDRHRLAGPFAKIFVLEDPDDRASILGYYCLAAGQIERDWVSNKLAKQIPRDIAPMALLGFMGKQDGTPKGIGEILLADAAIRISRLDVGVWGVMLHAENERLAAWYGERGFKSAPLDKVGEKNKLLMYAPLVSLLPQ